MVDDGPINVGANATAMVAVTDVTPGPELLVRASDEQSLIWSRPAEGTDNDRPRLSGGSTRRVGVVELVRAVMETARWQIVEREPFMEPTDFRVEGG